MNDTLYLIYRKYSRDEREDYNEAPFYAWTRSKHIMKAFIKQRTPGKYITKKIYSIDISDICEHDRELDYTNLYSNHSDEKITLITTRYELNEADFRLNALIEDMSALSNIKPNKNKDTEYFLLLFINILDYYGDALYDVGFRPIELDEVFMGNVNDEYMNNEGRTDMFYTTTCSLEGYIKVLKEDL